MVFTTNKALADWGGVLHDPDLAATILDRVLERGRWITLDGPSGRTRHLKGESSIAPTSTGARISGTHTPPCMPSDRGGFKGDISGAVA
jgi:hypothetical protein